MGFLSDLIPQLVRHKLKSFESNESSSLMVFGQHHQIFVFEHNRKIFLPRIAAKNSFARGSRWIARARFVSRTFVFIVEMCSAM
jgi:hypothetical protein